MLSVIVLKHVNRISKMPLTLVPKASYLNATLQPLETFIADTCWKSCEVPTQGLLVYI